MRPGAPGLTGPGGRTGSCCLKLSSTPACACVRVCRPFRGWGSSSPSFQIHPIEAVGMEAARPFLESPGRRGSQAEAETGNLPSQVAQNSSQKPKGPRGLGHRSLSLPPATSAHPPAWETLGRGRRAVSAPEADAARCKLLVEACPSWPSRRGRCPDPAWRLPASGVPRPRVASWPWLKWEAVPIAVFS